MSKVGPRNTAMKDDDNNNKRIVMKKTVSNDMIQQNSFIQQDEAVAQINDSPTKRNRLKSKQSNLHIDIESQQEQNVKNKRFYSDQIQSQILDEQNYSPNNQIFQPNQVTRQKRRSSTYQENIHSKLKLQFQQKNKPIKQTINSPITLLKKNSSKEQIKSKSFKELNHNRNSYANEDFQIVNNHYNQTVEQKNASKFYLQTQLKKCGFLDGDLVQIKINNQIENKFHPIYRVKNEISNFLIGKNRKNSDENQGNQNENTNRNRKSTLWSRMIGSSNDKKAARLRKSSNMFNDKKRSSQQLISSSILQLELGSKVFQKYQKIDQQTKLSLRKLRKLPCLNGIFVYVYIHGKGYLSCSQQTDQQSYSKKANSQVNQASSLYSISYDEQFQQKIQNIWKCILIKGDQNIIKDHITQQQITLQQAQSYRVKLINMQYEKYLTMDENRQFKLCQQEDINLNGIRFVLRKKQNKEEKNLFYLQKMKQARRSSNFNNIKQHMSYQRQKNNFNQPQQLNQLSIGTTSYITIQLIQCQQSYITLQQQLLYIKNKLFYNPTLKLIQIILQTMLPYGIKQFLNNIKLISEYIQKVFYEEKISNLMAEFLLEYITHQYQQNKHRLSIVNEADEAGENVQSQMYEMQKNRNSKFHPERNSKHSQLSSKMSKINHNVQTFKKITKYLNKFCINHKQNSQIFLPVVDLLFNHALKNYQQIIYIVQNNIFIISQFYKREWYHKLISSILLHQGQQHNQQFYFQPYFMIMEKFCLVSDKFNNVDNQLLIFHTIKQPEFQVKNILLNLYVDGLYIFVHQNNKDMELLTYLEAKTLNPSSKDDQSPSFVLNMNKRISQISQKNQRNSVFVSRSSKRLSLLQKGTSLLLSLHRIILYLQVLQMLSFGYNYPIVKKYQRVLQTLLSYCYKKKFPVIKDFDFIRWVLRCALAFYKLQNPYQLDIANKFRFGMVDSPSAQSKFKQKTIFHTINPLILAIIGQHKIYNFTPRIPQKQSLQMCTIFLNKCNQYYSHIKNKSIGINQIFQTRSVMGQPIQQYFQFLKIIFNNRLLKFKQKKKAQFMQYIQKLFENVLPQSDNKQQQNLNEDTLITTFINFLLKIISYDKQYKNYLQKLNIKPSYSPNIMQNPLINKKTNIKKLKIFNCDEHCTKIMRIKLLNTYIEAVEENKSNYRRANRNRNKYKGVEIQKENQPVAHNENSDKNKQKSDLYALKHSSHTDMNLIRSLNRQEQINVQNSMNRRPAMSPQIQQQQRQNYNSSNNLISFQTFISSTNLLEQSQQSQKFLSLKRKSLQLLILIILNINQEFIQQSVQTLNYFIKNPTILNWSSFELFESIPKYQNQYKIRKRILEQWYLISDPETFQILTTILRLLHRKVSIHLNKISSIEIITDNQLNQILTSMNDNCKEIHKMAKTINSWFKEQLFSVGQHSIQQTFGYFDQKLQNFVQMLSKTKQLKDCGCVSIQFQVKKILINLSTLQWLKQILFHIVKQNRHIQNHYIKNVSFYNINTNKKNTILLYVKMIKSYVQKICYIINYLIENKEIDKVAISEQKIYKVEYETNLAYLQGILCLLGDQMSEIYQTRVILIKIVQIARSHYDLNYIKYLTSKQLHNIFINKESILSLFNLSMTCKDHQIIQLSIKYYQFLQRLQSQNMNKLKQHVYQMTSGSVYMNEQKIKYSTIFKTIVDHHKEGQYGGNGKLYKMENSWYYFMYKLTLIQKKYMELTVYHVPLLSYFYQNLLGLIIQNQQNYNNSNLLNINNNQFLSSKYKKQQHSSLLSSNHNNKISHRDLQKIKIQIQKKKYVVYFICDYIQFQPNNFTSKNKINFNNASLNKNQMLKKSRKLNKPNYKININELSPSNNNNNNIYFIRSYITKQLTNIGFYQKLQKIVANLQSTAHKHKNSTSKLLKQMEELFLQYLEYYIYDLVSLLYLLDESQKFDKIHANLLKLHNKFNQMLKNNSIGNIERHYSASAVEKILKQLEEKRQILKLKNPRHTFQPCLLYKCLNVKNIRFLQNKEIKKLQATASRKWKKAIKVLQGNSIPSQVQFLYQIDHFSQIYNVKTKQQLNSVINNQDLLKKLISVTQNLPRLIKSTQNKIFILSEIKKLIKSKYFLNFVVNQQQSREILAEMILEQLQQEEIIDQRVGEQYGRRKGEEYQRWNENIFVVCIKLKIIKLLQYFAHQYTLNSLQILISLLKKSRKLFLNDSLKIRIAQKQFKQIEISMEPFYIILEIFADQVAIQYLSSDLLTQILTQIYISTVENLYFQEYQWEYDKEVKRNNKYIQHNKIKFKLIQKLVKIPKCLKILQKISQYFKISSSDQLKLSRSLTKSNRQRFYSQQDQQSPKNNRLDHKINQTLQNNNYVGNRKNTISTLQKILLYRQYCNIQAKQKTHNYLHMMGLNYNIGTNSINGNFRSMINK